MNMDAKTEIEQLTRDLVRYQDAYYKEGKPLVSDLEYDKAWDRLLLLERENPELALPDSPTKRVGSDLTNDFPEFEHSIPVLSLDKAYSKEEVLSFFSKSIQKDGDGLSFAAEEKIDGISIVLYYEDGILVRAVTRGNGEVGNDVTPNIMTIPTVPLSLPEPVDIAVRGEVYLSKREFERINREVEDEKDKAANPRNLAAGTVRRQKSSEAARIPLDIFCYEGFWNDKSEEPKDHLHILSKLKSLGFRTDPELAFFDQNRSKAEEKLRQAGLDGVGYGFDELEDYLRKKSETRESLAYEIDGLVFKINELDTREKFGYTEHHPRWAIAYKFESPQAFAILKDVTCQIGRTGRVTPVAEISDTALSGSTIRRATLHNQEYIDQLELAIGDTVSITKRGDVIPAVEEVVEKNSLGNTTFKMPSLCPICGAELVKDGAHLFCPNYDCPEQVKGRISYFAGRDQMDIESLGPKTVEILYKEGLLKSVEDIYSADYDKMIGKPGFGVKTVENLKKGVLESINRPYKTVLASLGIAEIGSKSADILYNAGFDSVSKLIAAADKGDISVFTSIKGMGESTAETLVKAFTDKHVLETVSMLSAHGLHLDSALDIKDEAIVENIFLNQVWVATGSFENFNPRSKALAEIEKRGGRTASSVTGKTTHLLAGKGGGSKRKEAEKLGVAIVSEDEFIALLQGEALSVSAANQAESDDVKNKDEKQEPMQLSLFDEL